MTIDQAISRYATYISTEKRLAAGTVGNYLFDLHDLQTFLAQQDVLDMEELSSRDLRDWEMLHMERGESAGTVKRRLSSISSWLRFLRRSGWLDRDLMAQVSSPKRPKRLPVLFKESETSHIYDDSLFPDDFWGLRDRLILRLLYETGMRRSELTGLRNDSIDLSRMVIKVLGKRNKQRLVPIENEMAHNISTYISFKQQTVGYTEWLFVGKRGGQLSPGSVYTIVQRYMNTLSTADRVSPHVFRHSFATHILNQGGDLLAIKELLGHEDLSTTEVYTHVSRQHLKEVYLKAHPRSRYNENQTNTLKNKEDKL